MCARPVPGRRLIPTSPPCGRQRSFMKSPSSCNRKAKAQTRTLKLSVHIWCTIFSDIITNAAVWNRSDLGESLPRESHGLLQLAVIAHNPPRQTDLEQAERIMPERILRQEREHRSIPVWVVMGTTVLIAAC